MKAGPGPASPARAAAGHIIVVEDEPITRALFCGILENAGFGVSQVATAAELERCDLDGADLVLLDIELPDGDGFELAQRLRDRSEIGIIHVSNRSAPRDRVKGLENGGDDFIVKPPDPDELLARVRAVLRRRTSERAVEVEVEATTVFAGHTYDPGSAVLTSPSGQRVSLPQGEARVLSALLGAHGAVVQRATLSRALAQGEGVPGTRSIDVLVHRLRRKLGEGGSIHPQIVLTVQGVGYRIGVAVSG